MVPTDVEYNLILSTVRSATDEVTALRLDWDSQTNATDYYVYRMDPFAPSPTYDLIDDGVSANNFYEDSDIMGNEAYQYYITGIFCGVEANESNEVFALLENAEDNVNTNSVWETAGGTNGNPDWLVMKWGICSNYPANGTGQWNVRGYDQILPGSVCLGWWTGTHGLLCSPVIPLPSGSTTAYVEFNVMIHAMPVIYDQCGGSVGISDRLRNSGYVPSNDYREGWQYNYEHVEGLSATLYYGESFPNIDTTNDYGYAGQEGYIYHYAAYNLPDLLTVPDARVTFVWGALGMTVQPALNYDDIAIIVY